MSDLTKLLVPRIKELVKAITEARWNEFSMRVPAEEDRDADLVLSRAWQHMEAQDLRIAELEAEVKATHTIYEQARQHTIENVELKQEVTRLTTHIRAIANYHDGLKYSLLDGVRSPAWELHHTERRDFALSGLEGK